jgi:hypothetical protein
MKRDSGAYSRLTFLDSSNNEFCHRVHIPEQFYMASLNNILDSYSFFKSGRKDNVNPKACNTYITSLNCKRGRQKY